MMTDAYGEYLDAATKEGKAGAELLWMAAWHPDKVRVVKGWSKGNHAVLILAGAGRIARFDGEALLVHDGVRWLVDDELMNSELGPATIWR